MTSQIIVNTLVLGTSLALVSIGLTLAYGVMHIVNFAHGVFYMLGAYFVFIFWSEFAFPIGWALVASIVVVTALALPLHYLLFRWVYESFMDSLLMTIGLTLFIEGAVQMFMGPQSRAVPSYFGRTFRFLGASITGERLAVVGAGLVLLGLTYYFVFHTKIGLGIRAVEQDREVAGLHGIGTERSSLLTLCLSFALAGAAGALMSPLIFIDPYIGNEWILLAFAVVILGGLGSVKGSFLAAMILGTVLSLSQTYLSIEIGRLLFFGVVGVVLLVRPSGLFGREVAG